MLPGMARPRSVPDALVHDTVCRLLLEGGDKAVSFGSVARATGLAGATLVGRHGSRDRMVQAALGHFWDRLEAATIAAEPEPKASAFLKAIGEAADARLIALSLSDRALAERAEAWRQAVETSLTFRLGRTDSAAMMFALWQGQRLWQPAGERGFRLKDAARRLAQAT